MKLSLLPKLVEKLVSVPVTSFCKISFPVTHLMPWNRPFSPPNHLTFRITLIYTIRAKFRLCTVASSNQPRFSLLTMVGTIHQGPLASNIYKPKKISHRRKLQVQDSHKDCISLLKSSNLEQCEYTKRQKSAKHPAAIIYCWVK
jgi:hypothetical protein